jgi:uncharacterized DUF497 family protein
VYTNVYHRSHNCSASYFQGFSSNCSEGADVAFSIEWDEAKRISNIKERGVDFRDAALIFAGPVVAKEDMREDYGEQRFRALGQVDGEYYVVAYTWRGPVIRIITAWKVDEDGRQRYEEVLSR